MTDTRHDDIASREAAVAAWLAPGLDIEIVAPTVENPSYTAVLSELNLRGTGATEDEALDALMSQLRDLMAAYLLNGMSLPTRGTLPSRADRTTGTGDV
jgi:hypothetical protein